MSVSQAERRLTSKNQAKDDLAITLAPHANWIQQIIPAPMAVASLAQLALLSTQHKDFPLKKPNSGFKRVKYPDSFKACLMQVSNEGYEAFNLSHVSMDEIRLGTMSIPGDMTRAVSILVKGTDYEVENLLPSVLDSIESVADMCTDRSNEVVSKYESVRELIDELLETGISTKGGNETVMDTVLLQRKLEEQKKAHLAEQTEAANKMKKDAKEQLDARTKEYKDALDKMPGMWQIMAAKTLEGAASAATMGLSSVVSRGISVTEKVVTLGITAAHGLFQKGSSSANETGGRAADVVEKDHESPQTKMVYNQLQNHPEAIEGAKKYIVVNGHFNKDKGTLESMRVIFQLAAKDLEEPNVNGALKIRVKPFYEKVVKMLEKVEKDDSSLVSEVQGDLNQLGDEAIVLQAMASSATKSFLQKTTPNVAKASQQSEGGDHINNAIKSAQVKVSITSEVLNQTRAEYNQKSDELLQTNQMLQTTLLEISRLDATKASLEEILKMLAKGLELLAKLKDQWVQLTQFFQEMANLIKAAANKNKMFVEMGGKGMNQRSKGMTMGDITRDTIYSYAREAVTISYVVNKLASGYVNVSKAHLIGPVARLPQLMVLEKENAGEFHRQRAAIMKECEDAQQAINGMIKAEKKEFERALENRMKAIKEEFAPMVKDLSQEEVQKVMDQVKTGVKNSVEDDLVQEFE